MSDNLLRYIRQIVLSEIGMAGQKKLKESRVLMVGCGGLGSPAALYLASAGVGTLGLIDDDLVSLDNLHRQILHRTGSVGKPKVSSASETLLEINPEVLIKTYQERLTEANTGPIIDGYDIVIDGSDNFETRYAVNASCVKKGIPFIMGSVLRFEGQMAVFDTARNSACYACVYPFPPPPEISPTCSRAGVIGPVPGIIGTLQALEAIKIIVGFGEPMTGKLLIFDGLTCRMRVLEVKKDAKCPVCQGT